MKVFIQMVKHQLGAKKCFWLKMLKIMVRVINDLNGEEIFGTFYEKETIKTNQKEFRIEKIIKRKGDELYVKLKGYNKSFNSWINKKDIVI